jgi:Tfp pilus assembly protein PilE
MSIIYLVIIAILVFIAYQLYQSNVLKKQALENREFEKEEERITAFMPHLYNKTTSEEGKEELKRFFYENETYNKEYANDPNISSFNPHSLPPHRRELEIMENMAIDEKDAEKKEIMKKALERMNKVIHEIAQQLGKRETTYTERLFVQWRYYNKEYDDFPQIEGTSDDYIISSCVEMFPEKK